MRSCPICSHTLNGGGVRCPKCQSALTLWLNYEQYARQAYQSGLLRLRGNEPAAAADLLTQAVILAPDEPVYAAALGRVLGQLARYHEAAWVLERAYTQSGAPADQAALVRAQALAQAPAAPPEELAGQDEARPPVPPELPATDQPDAPEGVS